MTIYLNDIEVPNNTFFVFSSCIMFIVALLTGIISHIDLKNDFKKFSCVLLSKLGNGLFIGCIFFLPLFGLSVYAPKSIQQFVPFFFIIILLALCHHNIKKNK